MSAHSPPEADYTRSVRMLVDFFNNPPDQINEQELQDYFLQRKNVDKWSSATMRICYSGIKFFFINVLKRDWHTLTLIHAKREQRLPTVLSRQEIQVILKTVNTPQNKAYLTTVYSGGLRLNEALHLQVSDIDKNRMRIHVHRGKGAKDRYVPLPESTLHALRSYWVHLHPHPAPLWSLFASGGPPTYWKPASTFVASSNTWATAALTLPWFICT